MALHTLTQPSRKNRHDDVTISSTIPSVPPFAEESAHLHAVLASFLFKLNDVPGALQYVFRGTEGDGGGGGGGMGYLFRGTSGYVSPSFFSFLVTRHRLLFIELLCPLLLPAHKHTPHSLTYITYTI